LERIDFGRRKRPFDGTAQEQTLLARIVIQANTRRSRKPLIACADCRHAFENANRLLEPKFLR